ncbi:MAG: serine/threonine-protein phosphatase [Leptospiraceae bacterium]|nr:serine/threonine-protein phosphatase [Leptospiraceae bacterium]
MAEAILTADARIVQVNQRFIDLFDITGAPTDSYLLEVMPEESRDALIKYLRNNHPQGFFVNVTTAADRIKHIRMICRSMVREAGLFFYAVFDDMSSIKSSMSFFEHSFDQFISTTIDLEEAIALIEKQKNEIQAINTELNRAAEIMKKDMLMAEILQKDLMPAVPTSELWDMACAYIPMASVSGDLIDFYQAVPDGSNCVLLLDASGHGVAAALITLIARPYFFRAHQQLANRPLNEVMDQANLDLCRHIGHVVNYLTGVSVRLFPDRLEYVNSGHPYMFFLPARNRRMRLLRNDGILLGIEDLRRPFTARTVSVEPGDVLFLYTDGLIEATNAAGEPFLLQRTGRIIRQNAQRSAREIHDAMLGALVDFGVDLHNMEDDLTFIVLKRKTA